MKYSLYQEQTTGKINDPLDPGFWEGKKEPKPRKSGLLLLLGNQRLTWLGERTETTSWSKSIAGSPEQLIAQVLKHRVNLRDSSAQLSILEMNKLKLEKMKGLVHSHTSERWQETGELLAGHDESPALPPAAVLSAQSMYKHAGAGRCNKLFSWNRQHNPKYNLLSNIYNLSKKSNWAETREVERRQPLFSTKINK